MNGKRAMGCLVLGGGIAMAVTGCGGGGSSAALPASTPTISGTVTSVAATVAQLRTPSLSGRLLALLVPPAAADLTGMQAVNGATVELVQLADDGTEVAVVASATTNASGAYQLASGQGADAHYMLRVQGSTEQLRAPLLGAAVDISPATEAIVTKVLARVSGSTPLSNFSVAELKTMVSVASSLNVDLSAATDVASAMAAIDAADSSLGDIVISMETATDNSAAIGGTYKGVSFAGYIDAAPKYVLATTPVLNEYSWMGGGINLGTDVINVDSTAGSIAYSATTTTDSFKQGFNWLNSVFVGPDTPTVSAGSAQPATATVTYVVGDDKRVYFSGAPSSLNGAVSTDGKVCAVTDVGVDSMTDGSGGVFREAYRGLHVFIKPAAAGTPMISATPYNIVEMENFFNTAVISNSVMTGTAAFDGINFSTATTEDKLTLTMGGTLGATSAPLALSPVPYTLAADGSLSIAGGVGTGYVTDDGSVVAVGANFGTGDRGLILGVQQATSASNATLSGSYNVLLVGQTLQDSSAANPAADSNVGGSAAIAKLTFDGTGTGSVAMGSEAYAQSSAAGGNAQMTLNSTAYATASFTYAVNADGTFTLSGLPFTITGAVSQDGSKLIVAVKSYGATAYDSYSQSIGIGLQ